MDDRDSGNENLAGTCRCPLKLVTMAGKEIEVIVPVSIYHHWEMLEDYLVELLAKGSSQKTPSAPSVTLYMKNSGMTRDSTWLSKKASTK